MNRNTAKERCVRFESVKFKPYWDCCSRGLREACLRGPEHKGKLTIGCGRNIEDRVLSHATVDQMLDEDADLTDADLKAHIPWIYSLSEPRQLVFFDLMFNMGWPTLSEFKNFLKHAEKGEFDIAATHLLMSAYARQTGKRARENAQMLRDGK